MEIDWLYGDSKLTIKEINFRHVEKVEQQCPAFSRIFIGSKQFDIIFVAENRKKC